MLCQIGPRPAAGGDGDGARTESFAAGNIARCIADDIDLRRIELVAMFFACTRPRKRTELIAVVMIVGECAKFEEVPDAVVLQLQLGATRNVSGQKRQNYLGPGSQFFEKLNHTRKKPPNAVWKFQGQMVNVGV